MDFVDGVKKGAFVAVEIIREIVQQLLVALQWSGWSVQLSNMHGTLATDLEKLHPIVGVSRAQPPAISE
jgi:hypothetical protein